MTRMTLTMRLTTALKKMGKLSDKDIERAKHLRDEKGIRFIDALTQLHLVDEKEVLSLLGVEAGIPFIDVENTEIPKELGGYLPERIARKYIALPAALKEKRLTVVMTDPFNMIAVEDMQLLTKMDIEVAIGAEGEILQAIEELYGDSDGDVAEIIEDAKVQDSAQQIETLSAEGSSEDDAKTSSAPIVRVVDLILMESYKKRASDIHIEPFEREVRVRYRIDGTLRDALQLPKQNQNALVARLKILSEMDITESRVPQDGRFKMRFGKSEVDYRVSMLPVYWGQKVVMRALDKSALKLGLDAIGFSEKALSDFKKGIEKPFGMIVITGPTGSGKSTTLYSILWELNTIERNIITLEDPIEYQIAGITQMQARPEIGLTFANGLRSVLRQSPDVVMLGEIRDQETGDIAVKASLTGQVVLTTLHTNDAASAVARLADMGIEPFLLSSSLNLVAAQRLCRRICPDCKEIVKHPKEALQSLGLTEADISKAKKTAHGKGCEKCTQTGYRGRIAVTETIIIDEGMRELIERAAPTHEMKAYAIARGMVTIRQDAIEKFLEGSITAEEVFRVTAED